MRFEEVKRADEEQVQALSALATSIVREHFDPDTGISSPARTQGSASAFSRSIPAETSCT